MSPDIKCIDEIDTFSNTGPHKLSYGLGRSEHGHHLWHETHQDDVQCLSSVPLVMRPAAVTILLHNSFKF